MKEVAPIMTDAEFAKYLDGLRVRVADGLGNGQDYNTIRCRLMGYLQGEETYAFTAGQLRQVFDLGFEPAK